MAELSDERSGQISWRIRAERSDILDSISGGRSGSSDSGGPGGTLDSVPDLPGKDRTG